MVNVIQQLHPRRVHPLAELNAPRGVITHITGVIDFAVEQFGAQGHSLFLGHALDVIQEKHAVRETFFVCQSLPIAGQHDHIGSPRCCRRLDGLPHLLVNGRMVLIVVNARFDAAATGNHRGNQPVLFEERKRLRPDQVNAASSQPCRFAAFALQVQLGALKDPPAHPLFEASSAGLRPGG